DAIGAHVGAHIGTRPRTDAADRAVALARDLDLAVGLARVVAGDEVLAARLDPSHRPAELARRERDEKVVRIELAAHAERAAGVALDHADVGFRHAEERREDPPAEERRFGRAPDGYALFLAIPF